jgi:hypothetical protein
MSSPSPKEAQETDRKGAEFSRGFGESVALIALALVAATATIIDVVHPIPGLPWVHKVAEIEPTVIAGVLLIYVLFERWKLLGPTKRKVESIEGASLRLNSIPDREEISRLFDRATSNVVERLSSKTTLVINETAEETYTQILRVLEAVERDKPSKLKKLRHGIFHAQGAHNAQPEDNQPYFADFIEEMKRVSRSELWDVKVLYNVTHAHRLNVVLAERLDLGDVRYAVRAMCFDNFFPVFSPMIIDDQHVFLAVFGEGKSRVSKSVYLRGEKAARFFADYFDSFWADDRVKKLREDGSNNARGIEELKVEVASASTSA